jgi:hypothetical protein
MGLMGHPETLVTYYQCRVTSEEIEGLNYMVAEA